VAPMQDVGSRLFLYALPNHGLFLYNMSKSHPSFVTLGASVLPSDIVPTVIIMNIDNVDV
jgi:hypothetical protein